VWRSRAYHGPVVAATSPFREVPAGSEVSVLHPPGPVSPLWSDGLDWECRIEWLVWSSRVMEIEVKVFRLLERIARNHCFLNRCWSAKYETLVERIQKLDESR